MVKTYTSNFYRCPHCNQSNSNCSFQIIKTGSAVRNSNGIMLFDTRSKALSYAYLNSIHPPFDILALSACDKCAFPNQVYAQHNGFRKTFTHY